MTPDQQAEFHHWQKDQAPALLTRAHQRADAAIQAWHLTDLQPLTGGVLSMVARGQQAGRTVVVKAPLIPELTISEHAALQILPSTPEVLDSHDHVLLLEFIDGHPITGRDAEALAEAVTRLHTHRTDPADHARLQPWEALEFEIVGKFADMITGYQPEHGPRVLAHYRTARTALTTLPRTACHGDLWAKNLLRTSDDIRIIDPFGMHGPAGWDVALAALSAALDGGDHQPVLDAGEALSIPGIDTCLHVAATVVLCNRAARTPEAAQRVLSAAGLT